MSELDAVERLRAWVEGRPLPIGEALPWARSDAREVALVAFVRMAGETSPWAVAWGDAHGAPAVVSVPDPRRGDDVRTMLLPFADDLLRRYGHPSRGAAVDPSRVQLVAPGSTHVVMLHYLEYRYARAKQVPADEIETVNAFGRLCGWLLREAQRPHQITVMDVTRALREAWAIPAEDLRQQHLGFVLAWLRGDGGRDAREARAEAAEQQTVGITLSPADDERLEPLVARWNDARRLGRDDRAAERGIREVVEAEVLRRWKLCRDGWLALHDDPRPTHPALAQLAALSRDEYEHQWRSAEARRANGDAPFVPDPETDRHAAVAASRFFAREHAAETGATALLQGDRHRVARALLDGVALAGRIVKVADEGVGRTTTPVWTIEAPLDAPTRMREGSKIEVAGMPGRTGKVRSLATKSKRRVIVVEITGRKTATAGLAHGAAPSLAGRDVVLLPGAAGDLARKKSFKVREAAGPGAWLTHGAAQPPHDPRVGSQTDLVDLVEALGGR